MIFMSQKMPLLLLLLILTSCSEPESESLDLSGSSGGNQPAADKQDEPGGAEEPAGDVEGAAPRLTLEQLQQELNIPALSEAWTGDLDGMVKRRIIRVLTVYGLGRYYVDGGREKGLTYELMKSFEDKLNKQYGTKHIRLHVIFIPVARDELIPGLIAGRGDIAAAGLTITPERAQVIDFSEPLSRPLSEVLVTGPSAPAIAGLDDLAGRELYVRSSSSYRASLEVLNSRFREEGKQEIVIHEISEFLEDEDLLEMVNSGALEWTVVDDYKAKHGPVSLRT